MPINLGEQQVTIESKLQLIEVRITDLDKPGQQKLVIDYSLNGKNKYLIVSGYDLYNFYMNIWRDGTAIFNNTSIRELLSQDIDLQTAENQFVEGLPTEQPNE